VPERDISKHANQNARPDRGNPTIYVGAESTSGYGKTIRYL